MYYLTLLKLYTPHNMFLLQLWFWIFWNVVVGIFETIHNFKGLSILYHSICNKVNVVIYIIIKQNNCLLHWKTISSKISYDKRLKIITVIGFVDGKNSIERSFVSVLMFRQYCTVNVQSTEKALFDLLKVFHKNIAPLAACSVLNFCCEMHKLNRLITLLII